MQNTWSFDDSWVIETSNWTRASFASNRIFYRRYGRGYTFWFSTDIWERFRWWEMTVSRCEIIGWSYKCQRKTPRFLSTPQKKISLSTLHHFPIELSSNTSIRHVSEAKCTNIISGLWRGVRQRVIMERVYRWKRWKNHSMLKQS